VRVRVCVCVCVCTRAVAVGPKAARAVALLECLCR
jgi:hypothetical protein